MFTLLFSPQQTSGCVSSSELQDLPCIADCFPAQFLSPFFNINTHSFSPFFFSIYSHSLPSLSLSSPAVSGPASVAMPSLRYRRSVSAVMWIGLLWSRSVLTQKARCSPRGGTCCPPLCPRTCCLSWAEGSARGPSLELRSYRGGETSVSRRSRTRRRCNHRGDTHTLPLPAKHTHTLLSCQTHTHTPELCSVLCELLGARGLHRLLRRPPPPRRRLPAVHLHRHRLHGYGVELQVKSVNLSEGEQLSIRGADERGALLVLANHTLLVEGQVIRSPTNQLSVYYRSAPESSMGLFQLHYQIFRLSCSLPKRPHFGEVSVLDLLPGGVARFHCNMGYNLQGRRSSPA
ncbi:hypothetical protein F7725_015034 [Dissostichus mawsoni]|uniref:Uncharacterized protein n=1 Tax=Dissostichus mawsoni TaxID=36200 RepID=A0A7J5YJ84_DISMA|nr:hypothetical protein F7725_015034 [Dissostichus mawsoni]